MDPSPVWLKALEKEDIIYLYRWYNQPRTVSEQARSDLMAATSEAHCQRRLNAMATGDDRGFIIMSGNDPAGLIWLQGLDHRHARSHMGLLIGESHFQGKIEAEAMARMTEYAFGALNLHRLTFLLPEGSYLIPLMEEAGLKVEGVMTEDHIHQGGFKNTVVMALINQEGPF
jgi:diamine N-acetyltransferase